MTGFIIGLIIGLAVAAPVFAYLGYRYGSKAVALEQGAVQTVQSAEAKVKKL